MERSRFPRGTRGVNLVLLAIFLVVMLGMAMLVLDLGMLQKARAEAQRAADAAALAGASAFLEDLSRAQESTLAISRAKVVADTNYMNGVKIDSVTELTVSVIYDSVKVRTKVRRAAVPTWFAKIFGIGAVPVGATAAAVADFATGTACVKPIAVPDLWHDTGDINYPNGNKVYDPGETWLYSNPPDIYQPATPNGDAMAGTGLGSDLRNTYDKERDWGRRVVLRPSVSEGSPNQPCPGDLQGNKCYTPGWWGFWGGTVPDLRDKILGCDTTTVQVGVTVDTESGWKQTLNNAVLTVFQRDPLAAWDPAAVDPVTGKTGTVVGSDPAYGDWRQSPRVWIMAMVAPADVPQVSSDHDTVFNNFMLWFFEGCIDESGTGPIDGDCGTKDMMLGRFVGLAKGTKTGPAPGTMVRILRLVE